eukprot:Phypoly_transcript_20235.p1 GENE.Phypoly_transcript_20235~~Phypoly_transcript_20235.p1  ORF type:complete len:100 (+),score=12.18 Phypoly_transcript_20235:185-484(+)
MNTIKGMRVLVTEDNQVNQLVAEKMLKRLGCEVVIAKDGYEALEKLQTCKLDLVFMDLHMPGLDGTFACEKRSNMLENNWAGKNMGILNCSLVLRHCLI